MHVKSKRTSDTTLPGNCGMRALYHLDGLGSKETGSEVVGGQMGDLLPALPTHQFGVEAIQ